MKNFKKETVEAIEKSGHKLEDVMFVGSYDGKYRMDINKFLEKSDFEYNNGYGAAEIALDLIVYFNDKSHLSRDEYDGKEWWKYNKILNYKETDEYENFDILGGLHLLYQTVREINDDEYDEDDI